MVCLLNSTISAFSMQQANKEDLPVLHSLDLESGLNPSKETEIERAFEKGYLYIARKGNRTVGYSVFDYQFNEQGYVRYIFVGSVYRGKGYGLKMLQFFETICRTEKIYVGVKATSREFQNLLFSEGYVKVGVIFNCEEIEPLNLYCKEISSKPEAEISKH